MPIEANTMELHAAEALLQLHAAEALLQLQCGPTSPTDPATLLLSCFVTPNTPSTTTLQPPMNALESVSYSLSSREDNSETNSQPSYESPIAYRENKLLHRSSEKYRHLEPSYTKHGIRTKQAPSTKRTPQRSLAYQPIFMNRITCEKGTQTDDLYYNINLPEIEKMDGIIIELYEKIHSLEDQLRTRRRTKTPSPAPVKKLNPDVSTDLLQIQRHNQLNNTHKKQKSIKRSPDSYTNNATVENTDPSDEEWRPEERKPSKHIIRQLLGHKNSDMVPIGEGYATVPRRVLKQIDWSSYTGATRKLLTAVFSRRVLATHSLTGKPSPAFPGKPAKKRLEPELVNDIVQIVVERCGVPENVVRTSITTKCADESKMYRCRQQNKIKNESFKRNQENVPPSPYDDSSDETY